MLSRSQFLVYLAGPITGLTYGACTDWREYAKNRLYEMSDGRIEALSPMRYKEFLKGMTMEYSHYPQHVLSQKGGITKRDKFDCRRSDLVLMNLLGAPKVSIGTMIEVGWTDMADNPIVLCLEPKGNVHEHGILDQTCPFRVPSLDEGIELTIKILCG